MRKSNEPNKIILMTMIAGLVLLTLTLISRSACAICFCQPSEPITLQSVIELEGAKYDASLWISPEGKLLDISKMVHIAQNVKFYEQDYYTPSDDGFKVFHTPFGNVGIVICFDRHMPESIRSCALKGADLIIIPTANTKAEPMEMFEWEMRVQAMQNQVFIAMCNRVGTEDTMQFAGESIIIHPSGDVIEKADDTEQLLICDIDLDDVKKVRSNINYMSLRRVEQYV